MIGETAEYRSRDLERLSKLSRILAEGQPARRRIWAIAAAFAALNLYAAWLCDLFSMKAILGMAKLGSALAMMLVPSGIEFLPSFLWALGESVAMALMGTVVGAVLAVPLALLSARTTLPIGVLRFGFRRFSDSFRSLDHLIWAIVFVRAVGLGPLAGIMAIALVDLGTLAKLYSEAIDNLDREPLEGIKAAGGSRFEQIRYGILPQVLPNLLSATLYMWESNTRSATILGIVGAGGIGYFLADRLRVYEWGQASLIILLIVAAVYIIDGISQRIRALLIRGTVSSS